MYYAYILRRRKKEWYIGYTNDLQQRMEEHKKEWPCELVYYEAYQLEKAARQRERQLKHYGSAWRALRQRITA
jgi:predicted GIY-YIG superfamily endonuclease